MPRCLVAAPTKTSATSSWMSKLDLQEALPKDNSAPLVVLQPKLSPLTSCTTSDQEPLANSRDSPPTSRPRTGTVPLLSLKTPPTADKPAEDALETLTRS